jgi:drug/metabolite transporter (DMT)-like permease
MLRLVIFSLLLAGFCFLLDTIFPDWIHPQVWLMLGLLFVISLAGHAYLQRKLKQDADNIMNPYLAMTGVRLLTSLGFIIFFIKNGTPDIFVFLLNFFLIYFLYVGFEIYWLVTNLRRNFR